MSEAGCFTSTLAGIFDGSGGIRNIYDVGRHFRNDFRISGIPNSELIDQAWVRRFLMGIAMGLTAVGIIYSPWGKQSGAYIYPALPE